MRAIRILLVIWGLVCLITPVYTALQYPVIKISTPSAMNAIENTFINLKAMNEDESTRYQFFKNGVIGNDRGLRNSVKVRQSAITVIGLFSAIMCFSGAILLPHLTRRLNRTSAAQKPLN